MKKCSAIINFFTFETFTIGRPMKQFLLISLVLTLSAETISSQNLEWAKSMGGVGSQTGNALCVDNEGNVYTTGQFADTVDFDPGPNTYFLTSAGGLLLRSDIFIQKLDAAGNFLWAKSIGGKGDDRPESITLDRSGNVYVTGWFRDTADFDPGTGVSILATTDSTDMDMFVEKLDPDGNFIWAQRTGSIGVDHGLSVTTDFEDNILISGDFNYTVDFDPHPSSVFNLSASTGTGFILKLNPSGQFLWAIKTGPGAINSITTDDSGNVYTTGYFTSMVDFDPGPSVYNLDASTSADIFVLKLGVAGNFVWAKNMGGMSSGVVNWGLSVAVDSLGYVYFAGEFGAVVDFDPGPGILQLTAIAGQDIFIGKLDNYGNFVWVKSLGTANHDNFEAITLDNASNVYATGKFQGIFDFDPGVGLFTLTTQFNNNNSYLLKLDDDGNFLSVQEFENMGVNSSSSPQAIALDKFENIYLTGSVFGQADFDPGEDTVTLSSAGGGDIYIVKLNQNDCSNHALIIDSALNVTCHSSGFASAYMLHGVAPYSFVWGTTPPTFDTSAIFPASGIYPLTVTDSLGCKRKSGVLINGPHIINDFDLNASLVAGGFRQGVRSLLTLDGLNHGCAPVSGTLMIILDTIVSYDYSVPPADSIRGDTLFWNFDSQSYDSAHLAPKVYVTTRLGTPPGHQLCFTVIITPLNGDIDPKNNRKKYCYSVVAAVDPNDKQVYPKGNCNAGFVIDTQLLTYTIRFQNVGNVDAINVYILDSLNSKLDVNSVRIMGKSHDKLVTEVLPGDVLKFRFDNIHLADSLTNEPASHGYVIFEVSPKPGLLNSTVVSNKAGIYFDFNEPVITNSVSNTFVYAVPEYSDSITQTSCESFTLNSQTFSASGLYTQTLFTADGCDSLVVLNLTINHANDSSIVETVCRQYTFNAQTYTATGTYLQVFTNQHGCDSTIILNLTINNTDTSITQSSNTLTANALGATYQWLNCDSNTIVTGETAQSFNAIVNGDYAVIINQNNCTDTSVCFSITSVGLDATPRDIQLIYPNPASGLFTVTTGKQKSSTYTIADTKGAVILRGKTNNGQFTLDLFTFENGIYFLKIGDSVYKLIKK